MHRSRLGGVVVDCRSDDLDAATALRSESLGRPVSPGDTSGSGRYVMWELPPNEVGIEIQKVDHAGRVHIDIETDDVVSEVQRAERLGAERVRKKPARVVMWAPTGQRCCVLLPQRAAFGQQGNGWPREA